eukprot:Lankesteria_metandrocarpae@DN5422_c0_g1_i2.p1
MSSVAASHMADLTAVKRAIRDFGVIVAGFIRQSEGINTVYGEKPSETVLTRLFHSQDVGTNGGAPMVNVGSVFWQDLHEVFTHEWYDYRRQSNSQIFAKLDAARKKLSKSVTITDADSPAYFKAMASGTPVAIALQSVQSVHPAEDAASSMREVAKVVADLQTIISDLQDEHTTLHKSVGKLCEDYSSLQGKLVDMAVRVEAVESSKKSLPSPLGQI